tara:strand:- start:3744 stop:4007 length:264 start_codon:yes stop_codon:yes gene_type:complete
MDLAPALHNGLFHKMNIITPAEPIFMLNFISFVTTATQPRYSGVPPGNHFFATLSIYARVVNFANMGLRLQPSKFVELYINDKVAIE